MKEISLPFVLISPCVLIHFQYIANWWCPLRIFLALIRFKNIIKGLPPFLNKKSFTVHIDKGRLQLLLARHPKLI